MEITFRKSINKLKGILVVDFILEIIVLIMHFLYLNHDFNIYIVYIIIAILFVSNILMEIIIFNNPKLLVSKLCTCRVFLVTLKQLKKLKKLKLIII
jgi:hypothetical protein